MSSRRLSHAAVVLAISLAGGCASMAMPGDSKAPVGTARWWRAHQKQATFVPGKGHQVAGVDGYFDDAGRPIRDKVAKVVDKKEGGGLLADENFQKRVTGLKEQVGLGPDETQAKLDFAAGEELFRNQKYGEAAKRFKAAAKGWPDSPLEQDAMYQLAESYFFADKYADANNAYEALIRKYPNSSHLDKIITRQFAIARYWEQYHNHNPNWVTTPNLFDKTRPLFDTIGRSMKVYENIRLNDPTGPLADDAIMASANSLFLRGRYNEADYQYDLLRKDYPRSDHQYDAHVLGLQCKLRKYQGSEYDGTALEEAQVLVKQLKVQFAGELDAEQRQRLAVVDAQLRQELATRVYDMAKYYDNIEEYGAARFYYAEVLKKHPQTKLAEESRTRLAAIEGLPDRPSSALDPVLDLIPESSERTAIAQVPLRPNAHDDTRLAEAIGEDEAPKEGEAGSGPTIRR